MICLQNDSKKNMLINFHDYIQLPEKQMKDKMRKG